MRDIDVKEYLLKTPLYQTIDFAEEDLDKLKHILLAETKIDAYCLNCGKETTFKAVGLNYITAEYKQKTFKDITNQNLHLRECKCLRCEVTLYFLTYVETNIIIKNKEECVKSGAKPNYEIKYNFKKIGQFPSLADLAGGDIDKYRKVLDANYSEFSKAIGLAAHGVGIGAFVYLRRVFEKLIEEAHIKAKETENWNEEQYIKMRIDEKIGVLKDFLPAFLVENRFIYSILSKGVHELNEKECLDIFPVVKIGIELILDEKITQAEQEEKILSAKKALASIHQELREKT